MKKNGNRKKNGNGRPRIEIDWKQFEACCAMQCTLREIADAFGCSEDTIERRVKEHYGCGFAETFMRKRQKGLISLRANLFKMSEKQGPVAIFLAKNWLNMADKTEITGAGGAPISQKIYVASEHDKINLERVLSGEGTD